VRALNRLVDILETGIELREIFFHPAEPAHHIVDEFHRQHSSPTLKSPQQRTAMRVVGVKALKNELSEYLRAVVAGETVLVTDRNRVVAELAPPAPGRSVSPADALLADAVRKGWVTPPLAASGVPPRRPVAKFSELMRGLGGDREGR
jgi:prevent-host-death family protein